MTQDTLDSLYRAMIAAQRRYSAAFDACAFAQPNTEAGLAAAIEKSLACSASVAADRAFDTAVREWNRQRTPPPGEVLNGCNPKGDARLTAVLGRLVVNDPEQPEPFCEATGGIAENVIDPRGTP